MEKLRDLLSAFGCSDLEKKVYRELTSNQRSTVRGIACMVGRPKESIHRVVNSLKKKGLVREIPGHPSRWYALPYESVIQGLVGSIYGQSSKEIAGRAIDGSGGRLPFMFIPSREMHHRVGMKLFGEAKKEVLGIASGRGDLHPDYYKVMVETIEKGVSYKLISLHYDEENRERLENWKRNGFQIRYLPGENVNVIVYDRRVVQFGLRLIEGSREKIGMVIENESFGKFMGEFLEGLWEKAKVV